MTKGKVLIAAPIHDVLAQGLVAAGYSLVRKEQISQAEAKSLIKDCVGVVTSTRLQLDADLIDAAPQLTFIARMGSGMEVIDVPYAVAKGIRCIGSPDGNANAVAEHALGMLLAYNKRIMPSNQDLKQGLWLREEHRGEELEAKTIGIIGYGHTGKALARLLSGFGMRILVYDKYIQPAPQSHIEVCASLEQMQQEVDILSLHVPYAPDTFHMIDASFLSKMAKPVLLINTSRGTVIDNECLLPLLQTGRLRGLLLDVWEEEPFEKMSIKNKQIFNELVTLPNVLLTPHIAGYSFEALYKMSARLLERIIQ